MRDGYGSLCGLEECRERFSAFYDAVKREHHNAPLAHRGHGLDHDVTVAQIAVQLTEKRRPAERVWVAAMLHSLDRMWGRNDVGTVAARARELMTFLPEEDFLEHEKEEILDAVLRHGIPNPTPTTATLQMLQDADMLANLQSLVIIRAGQFLPEIPSCEFEYLQGKRNPASTYHKPKSVLDDLRTNLAEYPPKLQTETGRRMGWELAEQLRSYIKQVEDFYHKIGLAGVRL